MDEKTKQFSSFLTSIFRLLSYISPAFKLANNGIKEIDYKQKKQYEDSEFNNILTGVLSLLALMVSIPVLNLGLQAWRTEEVKTACDASYEKHVILFGIFLFVVSLMGFVGACFRSFKILGFYLLILFLAFFFLFYINIFNLVDRYKGDAWMQEKVNNNYSWNRIKSCLQPQQFCGSENRNDFRKSYADHFSPIQNNCCKPSSDCGFTYLNSTTWTKPENVTYTNPDCDAWKNDPNISCFNCQCCKDDVVKLMKSDRDTTNIVCIISLLSMAKMLHIATSAFGYTVLIRIRKYTVFSSSKKIIVPQRVYMNNNLVFNSD